MDSNLKTSKNQYTMKKILLTLVCIVAAIWAAQAQTTNPPTNEQVQKLLPGTWVVENKALLPKQQAGVLDFLTDTLTFLPGTAREFKNGHGTQPRKMYEYTQDGGLLVILLVDAMDGVEYQLVSITENKLVILSPHPEKLEMVDLVYTKVGK